MAWSRPWRNSRGVVGRSAGERRVVGRPVAGDAERHLPVEVAHDVAGHLDAALDVGDEAGQGSLRGRRRRRSRVQPLDLGTDVALPQVGALVEAASRGRRTPRGAAAPRPAARRARGRTLAVDERQGVEVGGEGGDGVEAGDGALA